MTIKQAQKFGKEKALKATGLLVLVALILLMYNETKGDFANGIIFFIARISNVYFIAIMLLLFGLTFMFGEMAGKGIIINKKNFVFVSLKYPFIITLSVYITSAVISLFMTANFTTYTFAELIVTYFLDPLSKSGLLLFIALVIIWLIAANQMRLKLINLSLDSENSDLNN